jgi:hypothetical protein
VRVPEIFGLSGACLSGQLVFFSWTAPERIRRTGTDHLCTGGRWVSLRRISSDVFCKEVCVSRMRNSPRTIISTSIFCRRVLSSPVCRSEDSRRKIDLPPQILPQELRSVLTCYKNISKVTINTQPDGNTSAGVKNSPPAQTRNIPSTASRPDLRRIAAHPWTLHPMRQRRYNDILTRRARQTVFWHSTLIVCDLLQIFRWRLYSGKEPRRSKRC